MNANWRWHVYPYANYKTIYDKLLQLTASAQTGLYGFADASLKIAPFSVDLSVREVVITRKWNNTNHSHRGTFRKINGPRSSVFHYARVRFCSMFSLFSFITWRLYWVPTDRKLVFCLLELVPWYVNSRRGVKKSTFSDQHGPHVTAIISRMVDLKMKEKGNININRQWLGNEKGISY